MTAQHITATETAKLIRRALKEAFPGIRFGVRTSKYSMGASIRVTWTNGPTVEQVEPIAGSFQGAGFDGMQDLKTYNKHSMNGEEVSFGADYVFCDRTTTNDFVDQFKAAWRALDDAERSKTFHRLDGLSSLHPYQRPESWGYDAELSDFGEYADTAFQGMARRLSTVEPLPSPTAQGVELLRTV